MKLAMQFTQAKGPAIAGAASVALAEEVVRTIVLSKVKVVAAMILVSAILVTGAAAWVTHDRNDIAPPVVARAPAIPPALIGPEPVQQQAAPAPESVTRTIRGTVRDEQGRPVAKAWIGDSIQPRDDRWQIVQRSDRIRETKEPFRDEQGKIVPAGPLGKYLELRDDEGKWRPLNPADVRRLEKERVQMHGDRRFLRFFVEPSPEIVKALEKGEDVFEVCTKRGRLAMLPLEIGLTTADRTDALGQFTVEARLLSQSGKEIRFASADFSREAIVVVHADDPDRPLDITLLPVRPVRARVAVKPKNDPQEELVWHVYRVDPLAGKLDRIPMFGSSGAFLQTGVIGAQPGPAGQKR